MLCEEYLRVNGFCALLTIAPEVSDDKKQKKQKKQLTSTTILVILKGKKHKSKCQKIIQNSICTCRWTTVNMNIQSKHADSQIIKSVQMEIISLTRVSILSTNPIVSKLINQRR